jgi:hypothetical protein
MRFITLSLFSALLLIQLSAPARGAQGGGPVPGNSGDHAGLTSSTSPAPAGDRVGPRVARSATRLLLPWYEVDRRSAGGETTLIAVRNTQSNRLNDVTVEFHSVDGELLAQRDVELGPLETVTINLRGIQELEADPDGFARGYAVVDSFWNVTGDSLQVTPGQNFATGERLADNLCDEWDLRFLSGGGFGGGTDVTIYVRNPLGDDPQTDDPTVRITAVTETGAVLGSRNLFLGDRTQVLTADQLLAPLGGSSSCCGSLIFDFARDADGGFVQGTYSAEERYSVGLQGTCLEVF